MQGEAGMPGAQAGGAGESDGALGNEADELGGLSP